MEAISQLTHALTGKERLQDCTEEELRQIVRLYPFFGPAQVLLAKKKKEAQDDDAVDVSARAALFVPNPLWFGNLMDEEESDPESAQSFAHDTILETPATAEEVVAQPSFIEEKEEVKAIIPEETVLEEPATEEEVIKQEAPTEDEKATAITGEENEETRTAELPEETVTEEPVTEEEVIAQTAIVETGKAQEADADFTETDFEYAADPVDDITDADLTADPDLTEQGDKAPLRPIPSLKIEPIDPGKTELSFEPYHTVDYFASQGIRFREEEKPRDRLSVQLKSFTEWLKTLKKVPPTEMVSQATRQEEKNVEQMAKTSISEREVVTEAMAEVWEKQGNAVKAQELYEKLSLLDPSKSAYFAAKIEHLKQL
ncbi:MAG: hypothetical protein DI535_25450 [Citrobacter freundii]|nr:MAG: hypothetical protein DI535_25450 [Citrobacter freundii]